MDPLIFEGVHCSIHTALMLVSSYYGGIDFDAVGQGYASGKSDSDILIIGSVAAHGAEVLESRCQPPTSATSTRLLVYVGF